jgi:hypothetical protein
MEDLFGIKQKITKKILLGVIALGLVAGGGYYWWIGTPEYSLMQLRSGIEQHNAETVFHYVDIDQIFDNLWSEMTATLVSDLQGSGDGASAFGSALGMGLVQSMKPALKDALKTGIENALKEDEWKNETESSSSVLNKLQSQNYSLNKNNGRTALEFENGVKFVLTQTDDRYWQVTEIEGLDLINK